MGHKRDEGSKSSAEGSKRIHSGNRRLSKSRLAACVVRRFAGSEWCELLFVGVTETSNSELRSKVSEDDNQCGYEGSSYIGISERSSTVR